MRDIKALSLTKESRDVGRKGEDCEREQSMGRGDVKVEKFLQKWHVCSLANKSVRDFLLE